MKTTPAQAHEILTAMAKAVDMNSMLDDVSAEEISHFAIEFILREIEKINHRKDIVKGCKECNGETYIHSPTGEYLGECPYCTKEQEPYAYDVPTKDGTELAYAIYFTKYGNPLPEGAIPLYLELQEPVKTWICPDFMLPPKSEEVLVYPMPNNVAHTAFHDGECWRVAEYEDHYGYRLVALPDGFIKGWMPIPPEPKESANHE